MYVAVEWRPGSWVVLDAEGREVDVATSLYGAAHLICECLGKDMLRVEIVFRRGWEVINHEDGGVHGPFDTEKAAQDFITSHLFPEPAKVLRDLMEFWDNGTAVWPGAEVVDEARRALKYAGVK